MADIVLKDRNGNDVRYPGVNYLKVNTADGGTQGFAAYDPETLKAENIKDGVTVGDVEGALEVPQIIENMPIALDFSNGDMEITAEDGYAVKSAIVQKPVNLIPENIPKDVEIAGIVGTKDTESDVAIVPYVRSEMQILQYRVTSTNNNTTFSISKTLRPDGILHSCGAKYVDQTYTSSSSAQSGAGPGPGDIGTFAKPTITETDTGQTKITYSLKYNYGSGNSYGARLMLIMHVKYFIQGEQLAIHKDGYRVLTVKSDPLYIPFYKDVPDVLVNEIDLRERSYTGLGLTEWENWTSLSTIRAAAACGSVSGTLTGVPIKTLDFSLATKVPTLSSASAFPNKTADFEILVPAALYNEWIAATNWSTLASYIVPV